MQRRFLKKATRLPAGRQGFTLIEILVVIGIIAILATIVIIAINPARQFAQARNTQRESNLNTILNAIGQNIADNKGIFGGVCATTLPAGTARQHVDNGPGGTGKDLACLAPTYVPTVPSDPNTAYAVAPYTGYDVSVDATGRVTIYALQGIEPAIPGSVELKVTR